MMRNFFKYTLLLVAVSLFSIEGNAQVHNVLDGAYVKETNLTKRVIPYPHLREADVMYFRRIWQEMDLKQKINHPYYYPVEPIMDRKNLFDVIRDGLLVEGSLVAYSPGPAGDNDEFTLPLTTDSIYNILNPIQYNKQWDDDGELIGTTQTRRPIESENVTRYRLKEDWIWDRQRSERYVRIIGVAPTDTVEESIMKQSNNTGELSAAIITIAVLLTSPDFPNFDEIVLQSRF